MAATVTETKIVQIIGPTGRARLIGNTVLDGGTDNFRIQPGLDRTNITEPITSRGLRKIDSWGISCSTINATDDISVVLFYNTSNDADLLLINGTADQTYDWWVEGDYSGA